MVAAWEGNAVAVVQALKRGANPAYVSHSAITPLMAACNGLSWGVENSFGARDDCVKLLLEARAPPDPAGVHEQAALFTAAWNGNLGCLLLLIDAKADVDRFALAREDAARLQHRSIPSHGCTAVTAAAVQGHHACLAMLIAAGASLEAAPGEAMESPLFKSTKCKQIRSVKMLLHATAYGD
jgi:ankyrin repeat protein